MMNETFHMTMEKIKEQLDSSRQNWLFGAGISFNSNIPLMYPLTERVKKIIETTANPKSNEIYKLLTDELDEKAHIEHFLSHIGDLLAIAERAKSKLASLNNIQFKKDELLELHREIIAAIGDTVRYGYLNDNGKETIGTSTEPIVEIEHHLKFIQAVFGNRANLTSRSKLTFFSTNYDTLLEDALALEKYTVIDGFSGGAVAYWNPNFEFQDLKTIPNKCLLYKLHGSIDWHKDEDKGLVRARYGTKYLANKSDIMIYPQATKYVETQKDPFSFLFNGFRSALNSPNDNILITCGYSFGDEHINAEIEAALSIKTNRTTIIAFAKENPDSDIVINKTLDSWLTNKYFGDRIYVAGQKGIYYNSTEVQSNVEGKDLDWWTFSGLTNFLLTGEHE